MLCSEVQTRVLEVKLEVNVVLVPAAGTASNIQPGGACAAIAAVASVLFA